MTPREFLKQVVEPNIEEFGKHYDDIRLAFNAVIAVDALAAHLFNWCKANAPHEVQGIKDDSAYRAILAAKNGYFELLRDIAKAQKHVELIYGSPTVTSASKVSQKSLGWGEAAWDEGRWDGPPQVIVATSSGTRVVEMIVAESYAFLESELTRLGV